MASAIIAVANPVTAPTAGQCAQIAADISIVISNANRNGNYQDLYDQMTDLATAVNMLAQSLLTVSTLFAAATSAGSPTVLVGGLASSVGTVQLRNSYSTNQAIPTSVGTAAV